MVNIDVPGVGSAVYSGSDAERAQSIVNARHKLSLQYAEDKGWGSDLTKLTIPQILEIREQAGWKDPLGEDSDC